MLVGVGSVLSLALLLALLPANRAVTVHLLAGECGVIRVPADPNIGVNPMLLSAHQGLQSFSIGSTHARGFILRFGDQIYVTWQR